MLIATQWDTPTIDVWRVPAPTLSSTSSTSSGGRSIRIIDATSNDLLVGPIGIDAIDIAFLDLDYAEVPRAEAMTPIRHSGAGRDLLDEDARIWTFERDSEDPEQDWFGLSRVTGVEILLPKDAPGSSESWGVAWNQPWAWLEQGLAEIIFALTVFHANGDDTADTARRDLLDRTSFLAYADTNSRRIFKRQRFSFFRQVGKSLAETIRELVDQSTAVVGWGSFDATTGWSPKLTLERWEDFGENTTILNFTTGRQPFVTMPPKLRTSRELVLNSLRFEYGGGLYYRDTASQSAYSMTLEDRFSLKDQANETLQQDAASISRFGLVEQKKATPNAISRESAEGDFDIERYASLGAAREVTFGMGPLHFDFDVGEIVHVEDAALALDGTEDLLVREKLIDWKTLGATVNALELPGYSVQSLAPDELEEENATLLGWWKGETGVTTGPPTFFWDNQAPGSYGNLSSLSTGTGLDPLVLTNHRNGLDCLDFRKSGSLARGLEWLNWAGTSSGKLSYTIFAVVDLQDTTADAYLLSVAASTAPDWHVMAWTSPGNNIGFLWNGSKREGGNPSTGWAVLCWHLWRGRKNYNPSNSGEERTFLRSRRISTGTVGLSEKETDGVTGTVQGWGTFPTTTLPLETGQLWGNIAVGCHYNGTTNALDAILGELVIFGHDIGHRPLRARSQRQLEAYFLERYA